MVKENLWYNLSLAVFLRTISLACYMTIIIYSLSWFIVQLVDNEDRRKTTNYCLEGVKTILKTQRVFLFFF